jgi:Caspase domain
MVHWRICRRGFRSQEPAVKFSDHCHADGDPAPKNGGGRPKESGLRLDTAYRSMDLAIKRHIAKIHDAGSDAISFFYYSGLGAANPVTRINYLIPVDVADAETDERWQQAFESSDLVDKLSSQAPDAMHYVVFDAYRDELKLKQSGK